MHSRNAIAELVQRAVKRRATNLNGFIKVSSEILITTEFAHAAAYFRILNTIIFGLSLIMTRELTL